DGHTGLEWAPEAEVRILRVPPFALGIARRAVEEYVLENYGAGARAGAREAGEEASALGSGAAGTEAHRNGAAGRSGNGTGGAAVGLPTVTNERLDEAIRKLLPTHMQLIMGIGTAEELALAEVKAEEAMKRTVVQGRDADPEPAEPLWEAKCPFTGHTQLR